MAGISDVLNVNKIVGGSAGPGTAAGAIGKINVGAGTVFNAVGAGAAVVDSVKSIFGIETEKTPGQNPSAINNLRSYLTKNDILSNNLFYVSFAPPKMYASSGLQIARDLSLLCHQANLPGVSLGTSDVRRYGVGVTEKKPTFPIFTDLSLSFIGDGKGAVRNFFYNWMNNIVRFSDHGGGPVKGMYSPFEVAYKEDYMIRMEIVVLDRHNRKIFVTEVNEAYPIALGDQSLSWHDNDSLMSVPVTFTYYNWKSRTIDVGSVVAGQEPSLSLLGKLVKVGTALQTLSTIKSPRSIGDIVNVTKNTASAVNGIKGLF